MKDDKLLLNDGFGVNDVDLADDHPSKKFTSESLINQCSITKSFTAGAIAILVEQGKLAWDKPLKDYIPELEFADEYLTNNVTIVDLLSHRTGLPSPETFFQGTKVYYDNVTHDNMLKALKYFKPTSPFRTTMTYNNYIYIVVADLVTRLSGMDYKEFVKKYIFLPLGMSKATWLQKEFIPGSVTPHQLVLTKAEFLEEVAESKAFQKKHVKTITPVFEKVSGDGGLFACGSDMIKWVTCLMNDGKNTAGDVVIPHMDVLEKIHNADVYSRNNSGWSSLGYGI
ncbi:beta-lactamase/transpeptidase-like protein [Globomyces pollinis-pini]|nr:beta-lactamase/transpeptidase-like protein [Globomyces pollinis-pini]